MSTIARHRPWAGALAPWTSGQQLPEFQPDADAPLSDYPDYLRLIPAEQEEFGAEVIPESSPWTLKQKVVRALWMLVGRPIFRMTFHNWYGVRRGILRAFGATVGKRVRVRPTARIEIPWNLTLEDDAVVGDYAILYSLGMITIGARAVVSQYAHLCAGTHDLASRSFRLLRLPITIGPEAWIATEAFVGPGVEVGRQSVLGARSSAYKSLEANMIFVGNPARATQRRAIKRA